MLSSSEVSFEISNYKAASHNNSLKTYLNAIIIRIFYKIIGLPPVNISFTTEHINNALLNNTIGFKLKIIYVELKKH